MRKQWVPGSFVRLCKILEPGDEARFFNKCEIKIEKCYLKHIFRGSKLVISHVTNNIS